MQTTVHRKDCELCVHYFFNKENPNRWGWCEEIDSFGKCKYKKVKDGDKKRYHEEKRIWNY
jgi:hypothetical protein